MKCSKCGKENGAKTKFCTGCGSAIAVIAPSSVQNGSVSSKNKTTAGLLAIFLGGFGIHKFYLGYPVPGVIQIVATIISCGFLAPIGMIEGILYLTKSDEEFTHLYVDGRRQWF